MALMFLMVRKVEVLIKSDQGNCSLYSKVKEILTNHQKVPSYVAMLNETFACDIASEIAKLFYEAKVKEKKAALISNIMEKKIKIEKIFEESNLLRLLSE